MEIIKDLDFLSGIDEGLADMILEICEMNISDMKNAINSPGNVNDIYIKTIPEDKLEEMLIFYRSMLDVFISKEKYEHCSDIKNIIENLEKYSK